MREQHTYKLKCRYPTGWEHWVCEQCPRERLVNWKRSVENIITLHPGLYTNVQHNALVDDSLLAGSVDIDTGDEKNGVIPDWEPDGIDELFHKKHNDYNQH